jgi:Asp-tRNA(Asn)/Glu-tRNA(Gln) amidotransferase A subunit family amidase
VQRLRAAGAVILGKTVTTELAYFTPGKTRNPRDSQRTPGGSSSGSAAAVADQMVPAALGTQTAGSVIRPAAFCGAIGFKPTFGLWPMEGIKALAPSLDTLGVFARSLRDLPLLSAALGAELRVPEPRRVPRLLLCRTDRWEQAEPAQRALVEDAAQRLARAGAEVRELPGAALAGLFEAQQTIMSVEMARSLQPERAQGEAGLGEPLRELFRKGDAEQGRPYEEAVALAERARAAFASLVSGCDALLAPSAAGEAPALALGSTGDPVFSRVFTLLHAPCVSLPAGTGPGGLPLGLQLVAPPGADPSLLAWAEWASVRL